MIPDSTRLRSRCEAEEAALRACMVDLAARYDPPFSPLQKRKFGQRLRDAEVNFARISLLNAQFRIGGAGLPADRQFFHRHYLLFPLWQTHLTRLRVMLRTKPQPLYPDAADPSRTETAALIATDRLLERLHLGLSPHPPELHPGEGPAHGDIPLPMSQFQRHMQAAKRVLRAMGQGRGKFLDVGCGIGLKVIAAAEYVDLAEGLEYDAALCATARHLTENAETIRRAAATATTPWLMPQAGATGRVFQADALRFEAYGDYDVIYAYRPISDATLRRALEARIVAQARPDTLLIFPYPEFCEQAEALGCTQIEGALYLASWKGVDVAQLRFRAGHVGNARPTPPVGGYPDEGFVTPLTGLLRSWGQIG